MIGGVSAFYHGMLLGLIFLVSFGPVFFALIETSINRGFWPAVNIAIGTILSDAAYVIICFLGVTTFLESDEIRFWIGITGGLVLIFIGAFTFFKKPKIEHVQLITPNSFGNVTYAIKGFLINSLNPFVFIFWLSTMGIVSVEYQNSATDRLVFFSGTLFCIFSSDILKAFVANKIKLLLNQRLMTLFNRIAGIVMLYFGFELMWNVWNGKGF